MATCFPCGCEDGVVVQVRSRVYYGKRDLCYVAQDGDTYYGTSQVQTELQVLEANTRNVIDECTYTSTVSATDPYCEFTLEDPPPDCCTEPVPVISEPCGEGLSPCDVAPIEEDCVATGDTTVVNSDPLSPPGTPTLVPLADWTEWETMIAIIKDDFRGPDLVCASGGGGGADAFKSAFPDSHEAGRTVLELRLAPNSPRIPVVVRFHVSETPSGGSPAFTTVDLAIPKDGSVVAFELALPGSNGDVVAESSDFFVPGEL